MNVFSPLIQEGDCNIIESVVALLTPLIITIMVVLRSLKFSLQIPEFSGPSLADFFLQTGLALVNSIS